MSLPPRGKYEQHQQQIIQRRRPHKPRTRQEDPTFAVAIQTQATNFWIHDISRCPHIKQENAGPWESSLCCPISSQGSAFPNRHSPDRVASHQLAHVAMMGPQAPAGTAASDRPQMGAHVLARTPHLQRTLCAALRLFGAAAPAAPLAGKAGALRPAHTAA
eukprot:364743-Chlamydomonas_euryale.AAC.57